MQTIIVNQPFGLGDIIFTQQLAKVIAGGRTILWPVFPQFVEGLNRAYPDVKFIDWKKLPIDYDRTGQYETNLAGIGPCTILPFRFACDMLHLPYDECMRAKYKLYGLDFEIWQDGAYWQRDMSFETALPTNLDIDIFSDKYSLINRTFGSDNTLKVNITADGIEMKPFDNFSLFDWALTLQNASAIHTVNTSIIYLLEMLDLKATEVHLYQRSIPGQTFSNIDYILKRHKYVFHP